MIPTRAKVKNHILRQPEFSSGGGGEPGGTREEFFLCSLPQEQMAWVRCPAPHQAG